MKKNKIISLTFPRCKCSNLFTLKPPQIAVCGGFRVQSLPGIQIIIPMKYPSTPQRGINTAALRYMETITVLNADGRISASMPLLRETVAHFLKC
jgi:hypothetical protein